MSREQDEPNDSQTNNDKRQYEKSGENDKPKKLESTKYLNFIFLWIEYTI